MNTPKPLVSPYQPYSIASLKRWRRRIWKFLTLGGLRYLSFKSFVEHLSQWLKRPFKKTPKRRIHWLGTWTAYHGNLGDHAQAYAVERFFRDHFPDYSIQELDRHNLTVQNIQSLADTLGPEDLVFLQSSGDFGSFHDARFPGEGFLGYQSARRELVERLPDRLIINLPTTVCYQGGPDDQGSLNKDKATFDASGLIVLCRENESLRILRENLACRSEFFPDFVFYLRPKLSAAPRSGVRVLLRNDSESALTEAERAQLLVELSGEFSEIVVDDIMHSHFPVISLIRDQYLESVMEQYSQSELIITDKMHGMIFAVITRTPCIALRSGIPHKVPAYSSFLSGAVEFVEDYSGIGQAIEAVHNREYEPVDLREYFQRFRNRFVDNPSGT